MIVTPTEEAPGRRSGTESSIAAAERRTDARTAPTVAVTAAKFLSIAGHPFVFMLLVIAAVGVRFLRREQTAIALSVIFFLVIVPFTLYILREVRAQRWTNFDVSVREHRPRMYAVALLLIFAAAGLLYLLGAPAGIVRGTLFGAGLMILTLALNRWLKVSLHAAVSAYAAVILWRVEPAIAVVAFVACLAIGWSRVVLKRHTRAEVIVGTLCGLAVGAILVLL